MRQIQGRLHAIISGMRMRRAERAAGPGASHSETDWLPPVLGPQDWSMGLMADRSAGWYFDRH